MDSFELESQFGAQLGLNSIEGPQGGTPPPPNLGKAIGGFEQQAKGCMPKSKFLAFKFERPKAAALDTIVQGTWNLWGYPEATWASQNHLKSSPGASKIEPGALQDAIFKEHLS